MGLLSRRPGRPYEGWIVVSSFSATVFITGAFFFFGLGAFFNPVRDEFHWSVAAVSLGFSLQNVVSGMTGPPLGILIDRVGPRRVMFGGLIAAALGAALLSLVQSLWQFYAAMLLVALGASAAGYLTGFFAAASWFELRRARAMGIVTLGGGFSGLLVLVVAQLIDGLGWRGALRAMAVIVLATCLPLAMFIRARPLHHPQPMDGLPDHVDVAQRRRAPTWGVPWRRAVRSRAFLLLVLGQLAVGFALVAIVVHLIPFLESLGVSKRTASATVAFYTVTSTVGRIGGGQLADRHEKRLVMAGAVALMAIGTPLLAVVQNAWQAMLVLAIIAPGFGAAVALPPALIADYFGTRTFGSVNGTAMAVQTIGQFVGPLTVGAVVDATGHYTVGWLLAGAILAAGLPAYFIVRPPRDLIEESRALDLARQAPHAAPAAGG